MWALSGKQTVARCNMTGLMHLIRLKGISSMQSFHEGTVESKGAIGGSDAEEGLEQGI